MSLQQPQSPRLHLEPLEDRFLLSAAALTVPVADRTPFIPGNYATLTAAQVPQSAAPPASGGEKAAVVYPASAGTAHPLAQQLDSDGDGYVSARGEDDHSSDGVDSQHAEGLALVRSLTLHTAPPTGESLRAAPPVVTPAAGVPPLVAVHDAPAVPPLTVRPVGEIAFPGAPDLQGGDGVPPVPVVVASAGPEPEPEREETAPAAEHSLLASELAPEPGDPLAGLLPLDLSALRRNADAFFARLGDLVPVPGDGQSVRAVAAWLLLGAAAWEVVLLPRALRRPALATDPHLPGFEDEA